MNMFEEIEKMKTELPKAKTITNEFKNYKFNFYQIFSFVILFVTFTLGIILGNVFPACTSSSTLYVGNCLATGFNFSLMIGVWFIGLMITVLIFSIGHIIYLLNEINNSLKKS